MCIYVSMGMCECEYMCESMGVQVCVVWLSVRGWTGRCVRPHVLGSVCVCVHKQPRDTFFMPLHACMCVCVAYACHMKVEVAMERKQGCLFV